MTWDLTIWGKTKKMRLRTRVWATAWIVAEQHATPIEIAMKYTFAVNRTQPVKIRK